MLSLWYQVHLLKDRFHVWVEQSPIFAAQWVMDDLAHYAIYS
jgi:hypothetical protein